jgi:hypothetical protein
LWRLCKALRSPRQNGDTVTMITSPTDCAACAVWLNYARNLGTSSQQDLVPVSDGF